jgi:hypothetical protein
VNPAKCSHEDYGETRVDKVGPAVGISFSADVAPRGLTDGAAAARGVTWEKIVVTYLTRAGSRRPSRLKCAACDRPDDFCQCSPLGQSGGLLPPNRGLSSDYITVGFIVIFLVVNFPPLLPARRRLDGPRLQMKLARTTRIRADCVSGWCNRRFAGVTLADPPSQPAHIPGYRSEKGRQQATIVKNSKGSPGSR